MKGFLFYISVFFLLGNNGITPSHAAINAQELLVKPKKKTLKGLLEGGFADFFNITEQSRKKDKAKRGQTKIHYKTGGFKEHIDIYIWINKKKEIVTARLEISRNWLQKDLMFGIDVEKSFINEFGLDKEYIKPLVDTLWEFPKKEKGEFEDQNLQGAFDAVIGKKMNYEFTHTDKQHIHISNVKLESKKGYILVTEFK